MELIEKYIQSLMDDSTPERPVWNMEKIRAGKISGWDYIDGCMILAFLEAYKLRKEERFLSFSKEYVGYRVLDDGTVNGYDINTWNLDELNGGKNLLTLYSLTKEEKYKLAAGKLYEQILKQPRIKEGNYWHKEIYPNQVWLDGLYMALPFGIGYANLFLNGKDKEARYEDAYKQFFVVKKRMRDEKTGLYYHCYDESREMYWCNKETGLSSHFWLRSLGWFAMSMLDSLNLLEDKDSKNYQELLSMFHDFMESVRSFQTESGMWYQLPQFPGREKNYLETSGSAILSYCMLKGARLGFLDASFVESGKRAFLDITDRYLVQRQDGKMGLGGICLVAGLGGTKHRDGSYEYYMSEPIVSDDAKGTAPFVLAYLEMCLLG